MATARRPDAPAPTSSGESGSTETNEESTLDEQRGEEITDLSNPEPAPATPHTAQHENQTLLSAPLPAEGYDEALHRRMTTLESRFDLLESRVNELEHRSPAESRRWIAWLLFLLAVAVSWRIVEYWR